MCPFLMQYLQYGTFVSRAVRQVAPRVQTPCRAEWLVHCTVQCRKQTISQVIGHYVIVTFIKPTAHIIGRGLKR